MRMIRDYLIFIYVRLMMYFFFKPGWLLEQIEQSNDHSRPNLRQVRKMEGIYQNLLLISQLINNYHLNIDLEVIIQLEKELIAYRTFNDTLMNHLKTPQKHLKN